MTRLTFYIPVAFAMTLGCSGTTTPGHSVQPPVANPEPEHAPFERLEGFLDRSAGETILERTERVEVRASRSNLTQAEHAALRELMAVGEIFHRLYEDTCHPEAARVRAHLANLQPANDEERLHLATLRDLYWMFDGPIIRTLDNERAPLAPVAPYRPGRNIYPEGTDAEALQAYAEEHPDAGLLEVRSIVRQRTAEALAEDLRVLEQHPVLDALHPNLRERLEGEPEPNGWYAVPYSVAFADEMLESYERLQRAAALVRADDEDLADYLEQRARDLLTDDYEAGDAVWISGRTQRLNVEIGAYETYDDHLLGIKAFYALSILIRDPESSAELERAVEHLPELERALPGGPYGRVRSEIPIGVYDVLIDYGQARGTNTASILPNESHIVRRYGRTILIRRNILTNPAILSISQRRFRAAVADAHENDLAERGNFDRTVFHEVGHYLGPQRTEEGRPIPEALGNLNNHIEELKADLISLWLMPRLVELGVIDEARMQSAYAAGVLRTLMPVEPRRDQPYQTMMLMQQNYYLEHGLLRFECHDDGGSLHIDYTRYPQVVEQMLREILAIQLRGDRAGAEAYVDRWARWDPDAQGVLGRAVDAAAPRFRLVSYPDSGIED